MKKQTLLIPVLISATLIFDCYSVYSKMKSEYRTLSPYILDITVDTNARLPLLLMTEDDKGADIDMSNPQHFESRPLPDDTTGGAMVPAISSRSVEDKDPLCPGCGSGIRFYLGLIFSYDRNYQEGLSLTENEILNRNNNKLVGNGFDIGLVSEWLLKKVNAQQSLIFSVMFHHESGYSEDAYTALFKNTKNEIATFPVSLKTFSNFLKFDILYNFRIFGFFGMSAGLSPGIRLYSSIESEIKLPEGLSFNPLENPALEYKNKEFDTEDLRTFYLGFKCQASYDIRMKANNIN